ncbi:replication-associated recombination protein A [Planctobacterium marinum]|uniref:Replication-associated recombination protein A n=1 Tax=Planctobacterium marinum TaxID=1631968 RepID=A0AA48KQL8_9ALTE|nr:ATPase AAA [Planctobacterium marinum]
MIPKVKAQNDIPLAARLRPKSLTDYIGQSHLLGEAMPLRTALEANNLHSMVFWGPPGTGKTTMAEMVAAHNDADLIRISAVTSGIKDIREAVESAKQNLQQFQRKTILFVDEVHRFNKSQQDAFLPHIEDGTIVFIGATTENPAFELNRALLSRVRLYILEKLSKEEIGKVIERAESFIKIPIAEAAKSLLSEFASGDARRALNCLELASSVADAEITPKEIKYAVEGKVVQFDKQGDHFYDLISAFHKSVRGSSPDAALYWYCRILEAGGEPLYVARRLLAIASEDIGNADPRALQIVVSAWDIFHRVGPAEGERAIAQAAVYCASAAKSNAVYTAFKAARQLAADTGDLDVPNHLRNAPTRIAKEQGHGSDYRYAHNEPFAFAAGENYFPEALKETQLYQPQERGMEKQIKQKLDWLTELNNNSDLKRYD